MLCAMNKTPKNKAILWFSLTYTIKIYYSSPTRRFSITKVYVIEKPTSRYDNNEEKKSQYENLLFFTSKSTK